MLKIVNLLLVLGCVSLFAGGGGGGHSFAGINTSNKYGSDKKGTGVYEIPNTSNSSCAQNIKIATTSSIRYRNWFWMVNDFKSGYATTSVTHCGVAKSATLQIAQYTFYTDAGHNTFAVKDESVRKSSSYVKLDLDVIDDTDSIHTVHSIKLGSYTNHFNIKNNWGGGSKSTSTTVAEW